MAQYLIQLSLMTFVTVLHPAGNIAEHLVGAGLARVVDWHAGMLASTGGMERLRAAEKSAKEKRLCLYANAPAATSSGKSVTVANGASRSFDATVVRVWSADQISVTEKDGGKERRLQLSSTRGPKYAWGPFYPHIALIVSTESLTPNRRITLRRHASFCAKSSLANMSRYTLISSVHVKAISRSGNAPLFATETKTCKFHCIEHCTGSYFTCISNIAEQLIEKGLASVVRHKRDDEDRSADYDKLMAAEQK